MIGGITAISFKHIIRSLQQMPAAETAYIFGSRAKGNYRQGSDVDIAIMGAQCTDATALDLSAILNERIPSPYFFDVVNYSTIRNADLKDHIDRVGILLYGAHTIRDGADNAGQQRGDHQLPI